MKDALTLGMSDAFWDNVLSILQDVRIMAYDGQWGGTLETARYTDLVEYIYKIHVLRD